MHISVDVFHSFLSTFIFVGYWLLIVIVTLSIVLRRRPTTYVVAWLLVIYIVPLLGIILYFALGETHLGHTRVKRAQKMQPRIRHFIQQLSLIPHIFTNQFSDVSRSVFQLCKYQTGLDGIHGNQITLLSQTEVIFDCLISDIEQAKTSIDLVFYIWNKGGRADEVEEALIRASRRGVICRVMLDSAGSRRFLKTKESQKMRESGVTIIESLSVNLLRFMFRRLDLRQHRKVVIIDNKISYTGSMNIVDPRFFKKTEKVGEWVDIMIRMDGYITALMSSIYTSDWQLETGQGLALPIPVIPNFPDRDTNPSHIMQVIASGPGYSDNMIQQALLLAIYSARHEIIFTTPYFVPSDDIFNAICTAAQRGVDVSIIIPKKNDSFMVDWASRAFFSELLQKGVKLYQFKDNLLHTKSVLIDNQLSLVGTVNLDMRSLWLNFEITAIIDDKQFAASLHALLKQYLSCSQLIDIDQWQKRPFWQRIGERIFYFFSPLL